MPILERTFDEEKELENWAIANLATMLGDCVCLKGFQITTSSGKNGVPDAFAFNFVAREWYVIECELLRHGVWPHIAEQITRFVVALQNRETLRKIRDRLFEHILERGLAADIVSKLSTSHERLLQNIELFIEGVQPSVAVFIDDTNQDLYDFAHALDIPTCIYRVKKFLVNSNTEYYSPDVNAPIIATAPDEKALSGSQDYDVVEKMGGGTPIAGAGRTTYYRVSGGQIVYIKRSKFHERQNYYWYGIVPNVLKQCHEAGVTDVVFVLGDAGFVTVPLNVVCKYCESTKATKNSDGSVRHFHALISPEPTPELYWSADLPRIELTDSYVPFA